jgi:2-polyprenyl-6-hydroxyphenyl methylase/3-demethylubiquinone-9 3-methyltransferase
MSSVEALREYNYDNPEVTFSHGYLFPAVVRMLGQVPKSTPIFELGCGNGANAAELTKLGYSVTGVDPSEPGIAIANRHFPECKLEVGSSDEDLAARFGTFDALISLEVVEHVYSPRRYVETIDALLRPGGVAVISTPYHGYLKNLALALTNKMDFHFTALWEGGHIKFWSKATLDELFAGVGFKPEAFDRVGRIPQLAKSMVVLYRKPGGPSV